jgi:hypothetical protein
VFRRILSPDIDLIRGYRHVLHSKRSGVPFQSTENRNGSRSTGGADRCAWSISGEGLLARRQPVPAVLRKGPVESYVQTVTQGYPGVVAKDRSGRQKAVSRA